MFEMHIKKIGSLLVHMYPLIHISTDGVIKCSRNMLSLMVSPHSSRFIAALRLAPRFFESFRTSSTVDCSAMVSLDGLYRQLYDMDCNWFEMTMFVYEYQKHPPLLRLKDNRSGDISFVPMTMLPLRDIDVGQIDYEVFIAVNSVEFSHIISQLAVECYDTIWVTATNLQVRFSVTTDEVVFTTEQGQMQCIVGGVEEGHEVRFPVHLKPGEFFLQASIITRVVWFFKSTDGSIIINFPIGIHANILTNYR